MNAIVTIESQRKEMHIFIRKLLNTGEFEVNDEDVDKTLFLLGLHPIMLDLIKDYEFSIQQMENGIPQFELMNAEGAGRFGEHGQEFIRGDVTANSVVLKQKSQAVYQIYKTLSNIIQNSIDNLRDPHERLVLQMLFVEGKRYVDVSQYLEQGYMGLRPIYGTTFAEKRRKGIKRVAAHFKLAWVLEIVGDRIYQGQHDYKNHQKYRLLCGEWDT